MAEAARLAAQGPGATWVFAEAQTAARGRRGRPWRHPAGNFAASVILWPEGGPARAALRSFAMALALYDALEDLTGAGAALSLKWPNDVLVSGGKAAGILLETLPQGGLAIGVGVNLIAVPPADSLEPGALRPVSILQETGKRIAGRALLTPLAHHFARIEAQLAQEGFAPIRAAWLARAARLGETVTARLPRETVTGLFQTVDDTGAIVLDTDTGRRVIAAADINL